jgi:hypothetical protein
VISRSATFISAVAVATAVSRLCSRRCGGDRSGPPPVVEAANAEGGPVTKAEIRRAGDAEGSVSYLHATCVGPARCWAE